MSVYFPARVHITLNGVAVALVDTGERRHPQKDEFYCACIFGGIIGPHVCVTDTGECMVPPQGCAIYTLERQ